MKRAVFFRAAFVFLAGYVVAWSATAFFAEDAVTQSILYEDRKQSPPGGTLRRLRVGIEQGPALFLVKAQWSADNIYGSGGEMSAWYLWTPVATYRISEPDGVWHKSLR